MIPIAAEVTKAKQVYREKSMHPTRTRSSSKPLSGCLETLLRHPQLERPPAGRRVVPVAHKIRKTLTTRKTSNTGSKFVLRYTARTFSSSNLSETRGTSVGKELNELMTFLRTATSDTSAPKVAFTHEHQFFFALCLRLVVAITNYERWNDPGCEKL